MITSESDLPEGALLTSQRGIFKLEEAQQEGMAAISIAKSKAKECWAIASPSHYKSANFLQLLQTIRSQGYAVVHKDVADAAVIRLLYERDRQLHSNIQETRDESKIIAYFEEMLADALREEVSDIHIEKRSHSAIIKMRKHGEMLEYRELSQTHAYDLCSVIYNVLAENRDIVFNELEYQQAAVNRVVEGVEVKLRYQSLPVYPDGFDVVLRVLPIGKN